MTVLAAVEVVSLLVGAAGEWVGAAIVGLSAVDGVLTSIGEGFVLLSLEVAELGVFVVGSRHAHVLCSTCLNAALKGTSLLSGIVTTSAVGVAADGASSVTNVASTRGTLRWRWIVGSRSTAGDGVLAGDRFGILQFSLEIAEPGLLVVGSCQAERLRSAGLDTSRPSTSLHRGIVSSNTVLSTVQLTCATVVCLRTSSAHIG